MERRRSAPYRPHVQQSERTTSRQGVFPYPRTSEGRDKRHSPIDIYYQNKTDTTTRFAELERERQQLRNPFEGLGNKELPVANYRQEILDAVEANKIMRLSGETGSGKSTQTWQYLLGAGYDKVLVLVPRRVIANNLYDRAQDELRDQLGDDYMDTLGIVHGERSENIDTARVLFMTPNTYIRMARDLSSQYSDAKVAVMSDELHEANLYTEIATGVAAMQVEQQDTWRLILSSATHDTEQIEKVYSRLNESGTLPAVEVQGRPHTLEISEHPTLSPSEAYVTLGAEHERTMIFTNGVREIDEVIEQTRKKLDEQTPGSSQAVEFRKLHGKLTAGELEYVGTPNPDGRRVVIVSSPAGMSGITIPGLTLVISDGTINREVLNGDGVPGLFRYYATQSELIQMGGRAGRDVEGGQLVITKPVELEETVRTRHAAQIEAMPFMPYDLRDKHALPEIYNTHMGRTILSTGSQGYDFEQLNNGYIPHDVSEVAIVEGRELLLRLGAIDDDYEVTPRGRRMDVFPISPELSRAVVEAADRPGVSRMQLGRTALIAAAVSTGGVQDFSYTAGKEWKRLLPDANPTSDYMAQLDLLFALRNVHRTREVRARDIDPVKLDRTRKTASKILRTLGIHAHNLDITPALPDEADELHSIFLTGMLDKIYKKTSTERGRARYVDLHDTEHQIARELSDRSVMAQTQAPKLIAGDPRWFRLHADPSVEHQVVEMTFPVNEAELRRLVFTEGLEERSLVDTRVNPRGEVVEMLQPKFGSLVLGTSEERPAERGRLTEKGQQVLVKEMNAHPGASLRALREMRRELERLRNMAGQVSFDELLRPQRQMLNEADINSMMRDVATRAASLTHADRLLGEEMYARNLNLDHYMEHSARRKIERASPEILHDGDNDWNVRYVDGLPYITLPNPKSLSILTLEQLPDGRKLYVQVPKEGGRGTVRIPVAEAKQRIQGVTNATNG